MTYRLFEVRVYDGCGLVCDTTAASGSETCVVREALKKYPDGIVKVREVGEVDIESYELVLWNIQAERIG